MNSFALNKILADLDLSGPFLLRRDYGERSFPGLEEQLLKVPPGRALALDFEGIAVMDTSFADETILELAVGLSDGKYGDRFLILQELSPATIDNLEGALARRREKVALIISQEDGARVIGHLEANLGEAWDLVRLEGKMTARVLADKLGLQINTASMRLLKLHKARLLARREEITPAGRQHVYSLPE